MGMINIGKLPALLESLVDQIPQEIELRAEKMLSERLAALAPQLEAYAEKKAEEALKRLFGESFDLSGLKRAVGPLGVKPETGDDPASAGQKAAEAARSGGEDPVPAAARAAFSRAAELGLDALAAARSAAVRAGAGEPEAQRAAESAAA